MTSGGFEPGNQQLVPKESLQLPVKPRMSLAASKERLTQFVHEDHSASTPEKLSQNADVIEAMGVMAGSIFDRDPTVDDRENRRSALIKLKASIPRHEGTGGNNFTNNLLSIEYENASATLAYTALDPVRLWGDFVTETPEEILHVEFEYPNEVLPAGALKANAYNAYGDPTNANYYNPDNLTFNYETEQWEPYTGSFPTNKPEDLRNGVRGLQIMCEAMLQHEITLPEPRIPMALVLTEQTLAGIRTEPTTHTDVNTVPVTLPAELRPRNVAVVEAIKRKNTIWSNIIRLGTKNEQKVAKSPESKQQTETEGQRIDAVARLIVRDIHPKVAAASGRLEQERFLQSMLGLDTEGIFTNVEITDEQIQALFTRPNGREVTLTREEAEVLAGVIENLTTTWDTEEVDIRRIHVDEGEHARYQMTIDDTSPWGERTQNYWLDKDPNLMTPPRNDEPDSYLLAREGDSLDFIVIGTKRNFEIITQSGLTDTQTYLTQHGYHDIYELRPEESMFRQRKRSLPALPEANG